MNAAKYGATERLRNGASLQIRALLPSDRTEMLASIGRASKETLYRRFFAPKRSFSEREIEFFLNVDFISHVALAAVLTEGGRQVIVGGARYIVSHPGCAEVAFAIDDPHQKLGIATHLISHLIKIARAAGLEEFVAEVLAENAPMLKVFERSGLVMTTRRERGIVHVTLSLSLVTLGRDDDGMVTMRRRELSLECWMSWRITGGGRR
jgi:RimJ/RimL family protein N-acetyltransferase